MKRLYAPSVFILILLLNCRVSAQEILNLKHSCSFDGDQEDTEIYANGPSDEATAIIRKIMALNVLPQNFIIKSGNCKNALASAEGKQRYILYSTTFLESFKSNDNARWAAYCVMAHEIGHHLANHDMEEVNPSRRKLMEIQSDKFAGGILYRLGATLPQAQAGILLYTDEVGSKTHPPKSARLEAVASGWKQAQEQQRSSFDDVPTRTATQTEPVQKNTSPSVSRLPFEPEMVQVVGGTFKMGSSDPNIGCKDCSKDELPAHSVTLNTFNIGKYEVTQKQWRDVMGSDPPKLNFKGCDQCPVERVSWDDIQEYLKKLNGKVTGKTYRLPTEAEWEYAARGGNQSRGFTYSGSNTLDIVAWFWENSGDSKLTGEWSSDKITKNNCKTHPVGGKNANELGIYDMSGNVWEYCQDYYDDNYYKNSPTRNPKGPEKGNYRVLRGGSWNYYNYYCRVSVRFNNYNDGSNDIGFRLAVGSD